jgi:AcrR family transcriptional regulator
MSVTKEKQLEIEAMRRDSILKVALPLFFKHGYKKTTILDIANAAKMSKGLVYHYFANKEAILFSYQTSLNDCLHEIRQIENAREALWEFGTRFLSTPDQNGYVPPLQVYVLVFIRGEIDENRYPNPISENFGSVFFAPIFKKGIEQGEFRTGNPEVLGNLFWHFLLGHITDFIRHPNTQVSRDALKQMLALFETH